MSRGANPVENYKRIVKERFKTQMGFLCFVVAMNECVYKSRLRRVRENAFDKNGKSELKDWWLGLLKKNRGSRRRYLGLNFEH